MNLLDWVRFSLQHIRIQTTEFFLFVIVATATYSFILLAGKKMKVKQVF